jgi:DNA (cytosine-5)-methyltransferase 1
MSGLTVLSLFSGIGGLELGLQRAGLRTVGQVEINPFCRSVLARHWPEVPRHDDVRTAPTWWASAPRPAVDVVAGGFPCQPFSNAGRQLGTADTRWGWPWMADVIRAVGPRYVLVENVAALLADFEAFGWVLADLAALGFDAQWGVLPACAVGAPHTRDRLFLLAHPHSSTREAGLGTGQGGPVPGRDRGPHPWPDPIDGFLAADAEGRRMADGIPAGLDRPRLDRPRVTALGNAVVPAVAEHLGHLITTHHATTHAAGGGERAARCA